MNLLLITTINIVLIFVSLLLLIYIFYRCKGTLRIFTNILIFGAVMFIISGLLRLLEYTNRIRQGIASLIELITLAIMLLTLFWFTKELRKICDNTDGINRKKAKKS